MDADERFMWMALDLARHGSGFTSPNPMVGAVVVQEGEVVGTGYHRSAGSAHAEVVALEKAGSKAQGATLYTNLEPCCHHGKTPPCVEAILQAGIRKVVIGMTDPNPLVSGQGIRWLEENGVKVKNGVLKDKALSLNEVFVKYITTKKPFVMIKTAMSLDGKIATREGHSKWITGERSRQFVHRLRNQADAVVVGIGTVLKDDPLLTTRIDDGRDAARVVVDSMARLPLAAKVINPQSPAPTIAAVTVDAPEERCEALRRAGVEVMKFPARKGRVSLEALLAALGQKEMSSVLVEGGGELNYSFLEDGLIDKAYFFVAPLICGGRDAPTPFGGEGIGRIEDAWAVSQLEFKQYGEDMLIIGYPSKERKGHVYGNNRGTGAGAVRQEQRREIHPGH